MHQGFQRGPLGSNLLLVENEMLRRVISGRLVAVLAPLVAEMVALDNLLLGWRL